ncbi:MAG: phytanoyl-CoA dioxygenase family protein [Planctomycetes bacterium]|nr:phytanoyl-CoA dioxygenase family protein [Planctomycetota bacterium]
MPSTAALKRLAPEEHARFDRDGFLLRKGLVAPDAILAITREVEDLHERMAQATPESVHVAWEKTAPGKPRRIRQLMHSEVVSPGLNAVLRRADVLDIVEDLIGPRIALFHSKLLMKAARDGSVTPWHQDFAYWNREGNRPVQLNMMLAIDPATRANGCIQFVPGTHKGGLAKHEHEKGVSFGVYLPGYFQPREGALAVEMEAGDAVFFGSLVIHGSDGNRSDRDRRANTFAFTTTGDAKQHFREQLRGE